MKATVNVSDIKKELQFPCLMSSVEGDVIYVWGRCHDRSLKGVVIAHINNNFKRYAVGHQSDCWVENILKPFTGFVILEEI